MAAGECVQLRGELERPESWKKPGKHCGIGTPCSGLEDGGLEFSSVDYVFARRQASPISSASVKSSYLSICARIGAISEFGFPLLP